MGPQATQPDDSGTACREHRCRQEFFCPQSLDQEEMEGKEEFLARDGCTPARTSRYGETPGCQGCLAIATESNRSISHSSDCWKRVDSAMREDAFGAERLEESKRRKGEVAPGSDVVMDQSSSNGAAAGSGEVQALRGTRCTAQECRVRKTSWRADPTSLHTVR